MLGVLRFDIKLEDSEVAEKGSVSAEIDLWGLVHT